jgi:ribosomal protein L37AE/L43A
MPAYDPIPDVREHEFYCPECGAASVDFGTDVAYCEDCGWHGSPEEVQSGDDRRDHYDEHRVAPYEEDDWQHASAKEDYEGIDDPGHPKHMKGAPDKVSEIYNACMREGNGRGDTEAEKKSSCAAIAWSTYKKDKKSQDEARAASLEGRVAKIVQEGGEFCVKSEDGKKNLGCEPTMEAAKKRLQQVEYFKHKGSLALEDLGLVESDYAGEGISDREDHPKDGPLKCPKCDSHTVGILNSEKSEFGCKACGHRFQAQGNQEPLFAQGQEGSY